MVAVAVASAVVVTWAVSHRGSHSAVAVSVSGGELVAIVESTKDDIVTSTAATV